MTANKTQNETAQAFALMLKKYDRESQWEARGKLERLDRSLCRLYEAGCVSLKDFKRLDSMISNRMVKLDIN
jgi:hypothetical protein